MLDHITDSLENTKYAIRYKIGLILEKITGKKYCCSRTFFLCSECRLNQKEKEEEE